MDVKDSMHLGWRISRSIFSTHDQIRFLGKLAHHCHFHINTMFSFVEDSVSRAPLRKLYL
jgi:hypothetical protein